MYLLILACFMFLIGFFMVSLHYVKQSCPPEKVVFKYIEKSFEQEQNEILANKPSQLYSNVFTGRENEVTQHHSIRGRIY